MNANNAAKASKPINQEVFTPVKNGLKQRRSNGVFYLHIKIGGVLYRDCCNTTDRAQAEDFLQEKVREVKKADERGVDLKTSLAWSHFEQAYRSHLAYRVKLGEDHDEGIKESTAKTYRQGLDRWNKLWPGVGDVPIRQITHDKVRGILDQIRPTLSRSQFNRTFIALNEVFKLALDQKAMLTNPLDNVKRSSRRQDNTHIPERQEWDKFINFILNEPSYSNSWKVQIVDFLQGLCVTGLRLSEANNTWKEDVKIWTENVDGQSVKRGTLNVRDGKTRTSVRTIDLIPPAITVIERLLERYPKTRELFPINDCYNTFKHVCGPKGLNLTKLDKKGNRKPVRYTHHTCRHIFATTCLEHGIDVKTISEWLGHNDGGVLVLKTYGHLRRKHSIEQAAKVTNVNLVGFENAKPEEKKEADAAQVLATLDAQQLKQLLALAEKIVPFPKAAARA